MPSPGMAVFSTHTTRRTASDADYHCFELDHDPVEVSGLRMIYCWPIPRFGSVGPAGAPITNVASSSSTAASRYLRHLRSFQTLSAISVTRGSLTVDLGGDERVLSKERRRPDRHDVAFVASAMCAANILLNMSPRERPAGATTSSKNSTWKASWRSQNVFCGAPPISVCRRHSSSGSGSNNCSFPTESRSTEIALLEPA